MTALATKPAPFDAAKWLDGVEEDGFILEACYRVFRHKGAGPNCIVHWIEHQHFGKPGPDRSAEIDALREDDRRFYAVYFEIGKRDGGYWEKRANNKKEVEMAAKGYL